MPYISKVTGIPMVELATRCMLGETLSSLGFGTGLYPGEAAGGSEGAGLQL